MRTRSRLVPSRRLVRRVFAGWLVAASLPVAAGGAEAPLDLVGAWHLTIHYRDEASEDPEVDRWEDRVWRFERRGSRLQWTEFAIVEFENREGRFETGSDGRPVRVLGSWSPNALQLAQIERGLPVDPRGSRSKGLRGSEHDGFRSAGGLRAESTSVIGYSESWSVEGLADRPVFTQDAAMGSGGAEDVQGRTRYSTEWVSDDRRELRGRFERDGIRHGSFVLRRAGEPIVPGKASGGSDG